MPLHLCQWVHIVLGAAAEALLSVVMEVNVERIFKARPPADIDISQIPPFTIPAQGRIVAKDLCLDRTAVKGKDGRRYMDERGKREVVIFRTLELQKWKPCAERVSWIDILAIAAQFCFHGATQVHDIYLRHAM